MLRNKLIVGGGAQCKCEKNFIKVFTASIYDCTETTLILKLQQQSLTGTISVILSHPLCKDPNARFTTVFFNVLSDQI